MRALSHEEVWGTLCVLDALTIKTLDCNIGQLANKVFQRFFIQGRSFRHGVDIELHGGEIVKIYATVQLIVADEPALKEILQNRGTKG